MPVTGADLSSIPGVPTRKLVFPLLPRLRTLALLALPVALLTGCSASSSKAKTGTPAPTATATATARIKVSVSVANGARNVPPDTRLKIAAEGGDLASVSVTPRTGADGKSAVEVTGTMDAARHTWTAARTFSPATSYIVRITAGAGGRKTTTSTRFTTLTPGTTNRALLAPTDNQVVGVGMPVTLRFDHPVTDKAAVEKRLTVTSTPKVEGSWGWVRDPLTGYERVDWRPATYWPKGTKVTVKAGLSGVSTGDGGYLGRDISTTFTIGTARVSHVDLATHRLTVTEDGRTIRTLPVSGGDAAHPTYNGTMVVMEKLTKVRMNSETVGLGHAYDKLVSWTVHLTTSGTYIHAAPWNAPYIGNANASHGCVGMTTQNAQWFFDRARTGDIVTATGSTGRTLDIGNGFGDWNVSYAQWKQRSALHVR